MADFGGESQTPSGSDLFSDGVVRILEFDEELLAETYDTLRRIASRQLGRKSGSPSLNTTLVVHEAWLKLSQSGSAKFVDRDHYLATAARIMRQILIDHARRKMADKRGGGALHLELDEGRDTAVSVDRRFLALEDALVALAREAPELESVVECRFYAGLTVDETARALGRSVRTVERQWTKARAYLAEQVSS